MTTRTDFETRFAKTGRDIDEMISDTKDTYREERQALKDKWNDLDTRRTELADESESAWDEVKDEFEEGWNDVKDSYEDLKHKLSDNHEGHNH